MDRNARTPAIVRHYKPAPVLVWLQMVVLLGACALAAAFYLLVLR